jgi:NOL1/NOP2/fmu family ribosome biogenesis protein
LAGESERQALFSRFYVRFGIQDSVFDHYLLFKGKNAWWLMKNESPIMNASQLRVSKLGIKAFSRVGQFLKPSTRLIQIFGHLATKARLDIDQKELAYLLRGGELSVSRSLENGYVILSLRGNQILGLGLLISGKLRSQLPRKEIRQAMLGVQRINDGWRYLGEALR